SARPGGNVTVSLTSSNADVTLASDAAGSSAISQLSFTQGNWSTAQTFYTVLGQDADVVDDTAKVTLVASGGGYGGVTGSYSVSIDDDETVTTFADAVQFDRDVSSALSLDEGESLKLGLRLRHPPAGGDARVSLAASIVTSPGLMHSAGSWTFTSDNWDTYQHLTMSAPIDLDDEDASEKLRFTVSGGGFGRLVQVDSARISITTNDITTAGFEVAKETLSVDEGGTATYSVALAAMPDAEVTVGVVSGDTTAATAPAAGLTFDQTSWSTAQDIAIATIEDADADSESVAISLLASGGGYVDISTSLTLNIIDNDSRALLLSRDEFTGLAETAVASFTVRLTAQPGADVTVTLSNSDTGAVEVDANPAITGVQSRLTFTAANWNTPQTVEVRPLDDADDDDESVTVSISASGGGYASISASVSISITDDDEAGLELPSSAVKIAEGGSGSFDVRLRLRPSANVTVTLTQPDNTDVIADTDPDASGDQTALTFTSANWNVAQSVAVRVKQDADAANEVARIGLSAAGGGYVDITGSVVVSVTDDDAPGVTLSPDPSDGAVTVAEGGSAGVSVVLDTKPTGSVTVRVSRVSGSPDVTASPTTLTFTASNWDTAQSVTISAAADDEADPDSARLRFSTSGSDYGSVEAIDLSVTVTETQTAGVSVTPTTLTVDELDDGSASGSFTVVLDTRPSANVTVTATRTAGSSTDVTLASGSSRLVFTTGNWSTPQTVTVKVADDGDADDETATISLSAGGAGEYRNLSVGSVTVSVRDNDTPGLTLSTTTLEVDEAASAAFTVRLGTLPSGNVKVTLNQPSNTDVTVDTDTAAMGNQNELTFTTGNWNRPQTVTVSAAADDGDATDDRATITMSASGGGYDSISAPSVSVTVDDDETSGLVLNPESLTVTEGGQGSFTVRLGLQPTGDVTVALTQIGRANTDVTFDTDGTAPGGNTASLDFTVARWSTPQTVTVYAAEDDDGADDAATIRLTPTGGGLTFAADAAITVSDSDPRGLTLSKSMLSIQEAAGTATATFTVQPDTQPVGSDLTVTLALVNVDATTPSSPDVTVDTDTAATGNQMELTFTDDNWRTAQTVTVSVAADADAVPDKAKLELTASGADYQGEGVSGSIEISVAEKDSAEIVIDPSAGTLTVEEGSSKTFKLKLNSEPSATVTVHLARSAVDASTPESTDVTFNSDGSATGSSTLDLTFTASNWNVDQTVTVLAADDADAAVDKAKIDISASGAAEYADKTGMVTVTVGETDAVGLTVSQSGTLTLTEDTAGSGNVGSFTVVLDSQPSSGSVTVAITSDNADLTVSPTSLSFGQSDWSNARPVTLTAAQDDDADEDTARVTLTASGADYQGETDAVEVTITDDDRKGFELDPASPTVTEGSSTTFELALSAKPSGAVTVMFGTPDNADVTVVTGSLTFTATNWKVDQTVTVRTQADNDLTDDSAAIPITAQGGGFDEAVDTVTVSVTDEDVAALMVDSTLSVDEGVSEVIDVRLAYQPSGNVMVTFTQPANTDVTADADSATGGSQTRLTFTPSNWNVNQPVTVTAGEDDDAVEDSATLSLSASGANYAGVSAGVTVTVDDNDTVGIKTSVASLKVEEGGSGAFGVRLATLPAENVEVTITQPGNTDVMIDTDPGTTGNQASLTFTPSNWNVDQTVKVSAQHDDNGVEEAATSVKLSSSSDDDTYDLTDDAAVSLSVAEDDFPGLSAVPDSLTVDEGSSSGAANQFDVKLATQPSADVTITLVQPDDKTNPDVSLDETSLTFTPSDWDTAQKLTVSAGQDDDGIDDEAEFTLTASSSDTGYNGISGKVTVTVTDDDEPALSVSPASLKVKVTEGSSAAFTIRLDTEPAAAVTVTLTQPTNTDVTVDTDPGTANNQTTLSFTTDKADDPTDCDDEWNCPRTVTVSAVADDDAGDDEAGIAVSAAGGDYAGLAVAGGIAVEVTDPQEPELDLTAASLQVAEGGTSTLKVKLKTRPSDDVTVTLGTPSNAELTLDKTTLSFTDESWGTDQTVTLSAAHDDDAQHETGITFSVTASGGDYTGLDAATVSAEIRDDDHRGLILTRSGEEVTSLSIDEDGSATFDVALSAAPHGGGVTVTVPDPNTDDFSVDTSPASGSQSALRFTAANWSTVQTVTVSAAADDDAVDDTATFTLTTAGADYGTETADITFTVDDEDTAGLVIRDSGAEVTKVFMTEGEARTVGLALEAAPAIGSVTVTLTQPGNPDVRVDTDDVAPGNQNTLRFTAANWDTPQNVIVRSTEDADAVSDSLTLAIGAAGVAASGYESSEAITASLRVVVRETDQAEIIIDPESALSLDEGGATTFTVDMSTQPTGDVTVEIVQSGNTDITADVDPDTTGNQSTLTFTSSDWQATRTVTVAAAHDGDFGDDTGTISVKVSASEDASYATLIDATLARFSVSVSDDDEAGITLSETTLKLEEGSFRKLTVQLSAQPSGDVTVTLVQPANPEATADTDPDTDGDQTTLTFTKDNWNTPQDVFFAVDEDDDTLDETPETISISASGADYGDGTAVTASLSIEIEDNDELGFVFAGDDLNDAGDGLEVDEGGSGSFTVHLKSVPIRENVTVSLSAGQSGAVTLSTEELVFTPFRWDTPQSVSVTANQDDDAGDESVTISFAASGANYGDGSTVTGSLSVSVDDDESRVLDISPTGTLQVADSGSETFEVRLGSRPTGDVSVAVTVTSGPVTVSPATLRFTASSWSDAETVTVSGVLDDNAVTDNAVISLMASGADYEGIPGVVLVQVSDSDADDLALTLSAQRLDVDEGLTAAFTVQLSHRPVGSVTLTLASGDTGAATIDASELTFTSGNWDTAQTVTVTGVEDADAGDSSASITIGVKAGSSSEYLSVDDATVEVTVEDDETPGLTVSVASDQRLSVQEAGSGAGTFTVRLSHVPTQAVTVAVSSADTAAATVSPASLSFDADDWEQPKTVTVTAVEDADAADDDTSVTLSASGGEYGGAADAAVAISVKDDETASLEISASTLTIQEGATDSSVTVRPALPPKQDVSLTFSVADSGLLRAPARLTFTPGNWQTAQAVSLEALHDDGSADNSTRLTITAAGGEYEGKTGTVAVDITDDDKNKVGLTVSPSSGFEVTEGKTKRFTVRLATQPSGSVTLTLSSKNTDVAVLDGAVNNVLTLSFDAADWKTAKAVTVRGRQDDNTTHDSFTIEMDPSGAEYEDVQTVSLVGQAEDDDVPSLDLSATAVDELEEGGGAKSFQVRLNTQPGGDVSVAVASGRTASVTVSPPSLTFTSSDWDDYQTVTLTAPEDDDAVDNLVKVSLIASGADYDGVNSDVDVTTKDDETASLRLSAGSLDVDENGTETFKVHLSAQPSGEVTVRLQSDDTAVATVSPAELTFTASSWNGDSAETVTVSGVDDDDFQNEPATISLSASGSTEFSGGAGSVRVNVVDDDRAELRLPEAPLSVNDDGTATFSIRLDALPTADVSVTLASDDAGLVTVAPAAMSFGTSDWQTEKQVTVTGGKDANTIDDRTSLILTTSGGGFASTQTLAVTVVDTDVKGVTLSPEALSLNEGDTGQFSVRLSTLPAGAVRLALASGNEQAVTVSPAVLSFGVGDWQTPQDVTVTAVNDDDVADSSTAIAITASGADYDGVQGSIDVSVEDDDAPELTLSKTTVSLSENASGTFEVSLSQRPSGEVRVEVASADAAVATVSPAVLSFPAADWKVPQTVTVTGSDDDNGTSDTARINLTARGADYEGVTKSLTASVADDDPVGLRVSGGTLRLVEGQSGSFSVRLNTRPSEAVSISVSSSNPAVATATPALPATLSFAPDSWSRPQTVTVTGVQDEDIVDSSASITLLAAGGDYAGQSASVAVTVKDD
ncbi:MAG: hypothetical protein ISN29_08545, partial [Gammaproteobacteria bacterium AqS3]|nr:hypothetical protein [Gammaproteobacteria bacterium AqS3]